LALFRGFQAGVAVAEAFDQILTPKPSTTPSAANSKLISESPLVSSMINRTANKKKHLTSFPEPEDPTGTTVLDAAETSRRWRSSSSPRREQIKSI
jgi:hypothetical protein